MRYVTRRLFVIPMLLAAAGCRGDSPATEDDDDDTSGQSDTQSASTTGMPSTSGTSGTTADDGSTTGSGDDTSAGSTGPTSEPFSCATIGQPELPFGSGAPFPAAFDQAAADFTVETLRGTWTLSEAWSGCETYVFIRRPIGSGGEQFWGTAIEPLVDDSPPNVHYFFISSAADPTVAAAEVSQIGGRIENYLMTKDQAVYDEWTFRFHYVTQTVSELGWIGELFNANSGQEVISIDRYQQIREGHNLGIPVAQDQPWLPQLSHARYWAQYFNYEFERDQRLAAETDATIVTAVENQTLDGGSVFSFELPDAAEMANFDTLEIDLEAACVGGGHPYQTACPEWDRLGHIWLCNDEGCTSESELLRWITPYSSPGRWIVDASTVLGRLREGGTTTIRIESSGNAYEFTISLRLRDTAKAVSARQVETLYPYAIAPFNATYDGAFPEVQFTPPANATKVEFYGMISGHQFGGANNCAEFCNHGHTINVNGSEFFTDFTGDLGQTGCADKVGEGVVPNQGGTWFYGRAGWCPGLEVDPWIVDITAVVTPGQPNTLDYRGSFAGATPSEGEIRFTGFVVYSW